MTNSTIELHALLIWCIVYAITEVGHMTTSERVQGAMMEAPIALCPRLLPDRSGPSSASPSSYPRPRDRNRHSHDHPER